MQDRTDRVKRKHLKKALIANAEAHLELFRQGTIIYEAQRQIADLIASEDADATAEAMRSVSAQPLGHGSFRAQSDRLPDPPSNNFGQHGKQRPAQGDW